MSTNDITTGQFVRIEQTPAGIGSRILGRIIDVFALTAYYTASFYILRLLSNAGLMSDDWELWVILLAIYLPAVGYAFWCELLFDGQTLGKHVMRTRVVMADGSQPTIGALLMRWMLELVDIGTGCVGIIVMGCTRRTQRLGDLAAGTLVIARPDLSRMHLSLDEFAYARRDYQPSYPEAQNLSMGQAEIIDRLLYGRVQYDHQQTVRLADKVCAVLGVKPKEHNPVDFLVAVLHDYQYYAMQVV